nr:MAG TPA: hypothetical protein [Bacteriophage sp.]
MSFTQSWKVSFSIFTPNINGLRSTPTSSYIFTRT